MHIMALCSLCIGLVDYIPPPKKNTVVFQYGTVVVVFGLVSLHVLCCRRPCVCLVVLFLFRNTAGKHQNL